MSGGDISADVSKTNLPSRANAGGSVPRLVVGVDDPFGNVVTFQYCCDQPIRSGRRKRNKSATRSKRKAGRKPGRDALDTGSAGHSGARNRSSAGGT